MPSSVVGTCTTGRRAARSPRRSPPRSVVAPPPSATTASERVKRAPAEQRPADRPRRRPSWPPRRPGPRRAPRRARRSSSARSTSAGQVGQRAAGARRSTCRAAAADQGGQLAEQRRCPTTTSYGAAPPTVIRVGSLTGPPPATISVGDLRRASGRRSARSRWRPPRRAAAGASISRIHCARGLPSSSGRSRLRPTRAAASSMPTSRKTTVRPASSCAGAGVEHRAAAERQHAVVLGERRRPPRSRSSVAEVLLAVLDEDVRDRAAGDAPRRRRRCRGAATPSRSASAAASGRLARPRRTDQDDDGRHHRDRQVGEVGGGVARGLRHRVAAELLQDGVGQHQRHHRLGHDAGRRDRADVAALVDRHGRLAGRDVDGVAAPAAPSRSASSRRAPAAARPCVMPPSTPPARAVRRCRFPAASRSISSWACEPRRAGALEAVADLDALDGLDAHQRAASRESSRRSQCTWLPSPGGRP